MSDVINELVEDALRELSDEQRQRELWLAESGPEVSSLEECIARLWNDSGLGPALEGEATVYSPQIDAHLRDLRRVLARVDPWRPPLKILSDPMLHSARSAASSVLVELRRFASE